MLIRLKVPIFVLVCRRRRRRRRTGFRYLSAPHTTIHIASMFHWRPARIILLKLRFANKKYESLLRNLFNDTPNLGFSGLPYWAHFCINRFVSRGINGKQMNASFERCSVLRWRRGGSLLFNASARGTQICWQKNRADKGMKPQRGAHIGCFFEMP